MTLVSDTLRICFESAHYYFTQKMRHVIIQARIFKPFYALCFFVLTSCGVIFPLLIRLCLSFSAVGSSSLRPLTASVRRKHLSIINQSKLLLHTHGPIFKTHPTYNKNNKKSKIYDQIWCFHISSLHLPCSLFFLLLLLFII